MAGLLDGFFQFVDPILDTLDPMHNKVQTWTTGSSTTDGQSPYFQTIAPMIVDAFLPGVGSAISAADGASTGNWTKAGLGALGAYAGLSSLGSTASTGAEGGLQATQATDGLSSTSGAAAGTTVDPGVASTASNYGSDYASTSAFGPTNTFSGTGDYSGGMSSISGSPESTQFMTLKPSEYAAAGGAGQSLASTTADSSALAKSGLLSDASKANYGKMATQIGSTVLKQQADAQARAEQMAAQKKAMAQQAMAATASQEPSRANVQSFQNISPYAKFSGGYRPRQYGANVRAGLLG